jgi:tetratricopeptide (TPR) repeat protein
LIQLKIQVELDKTFDFRTIPLKNVDLALSTLISLLVVMTFLSIPNFIYPIQSTEAISNITNQSSLSGLIYEGQVLLNSSRFEEALVTYDKVLMIDSKSVDALNGKGLTLNQLGKYDEAITWFDKALEIDPNFVNALDNKGITLSNLGKYDEAIIWFDKALEINPDFIDAMYNKADALGELGKYEESLEWTDRALTLKPAMQNNSNSNVLLPND